MPLPDLLKLDEVLTEVLAPLGLELKAVLETDAPRVVLLELPDRSQIIVTEKHAPEWSRRPIRPEAVQRVEVRFPKTPLGISLVERAADGYRRRFHQGGE